MDPAQSIAALFSRYARAFSRSPSSPPHSTSPRDLGRHGEDLAAKHLRKHGYKVLYRNFRAKHGGEVDLVCRHGDTLVFVEVKTRSSSRFGRPSAAVHRRKQRLIARGALAWLHLLGDPEPPFRFDIVEVILARATPAITILTNAFHIPDPAEHGRRHGD